MLLYIHMSNIVLDHKMFDYSKVREPLLAVPRSVFRAAMKRGPVVSPYFRDLKSVKKTAKSRTSGYKLTAADLEKSFAIAMKEYKEGKLIKLR